MIKTNFSYYYQCKRCNYISKQKIDMKRHLEKQKKCIIINNHDKDEYELINESLTKIKVDEDIEHIKKFTVKKCSNFQENEDKKFICNLCNTDFHNKSNLNKHMKKKICDDEGSIIQHVNNVQNIGVQNNIIININSIKGFDEEWNISNISKDMREKLLLSDKKFTNTLQKILSDDQNLNVILKDETTGFVYKNDKNDYEAMNIKDIFEGSMDKIYKHLHDFFTEIINNNKNDIRVNILKNELREVDRKYQNYKEDLILNNNVNSCLSNIFDERKNDAIDKYKCMKNDFDKTYLKIANEY